MKNPLNSALSRIAAATIAMAAWTDAHAQKKAEPELTEADVARIDAEAREAYRLQEAKKAATAGGRIAAQKKLSEEEKFYLECLRRFIYTGDKNTNEVSSDIARELREATYAKAESAKNKLLEKSDSSSRMKRMTTQQLLRLEANARAPIGAEHARYYEIMGLAYTTAQKLREEELAKIPVPPITWAQREKYAQVDENGRPLIRTLAPEDLARGKKAYEGVVKRFEAGDYRSFDQAMRDLEAERRGVRPAPATVAQAPVTQNPGSTLDRNTLWTTQAEINEVQNKARQLNVRIEQLKNNYDVLMRHNNTILANQQKEETQKLLKELTGLKTRHDTLKTKADALTAKGVIPLAP